MLYKTKYNTVLDMNTAKASIVYHGNYTIAFLEVQLESGEICKTIGVSKYNPNDDVKTPIRIHGKDKYIRVLMCDKSLGARIALGRALAALRKGYFNNYSVEISDPIPGSLINKVFIKTHEDREFLSSQQSNTDNEIRKNNEEVLV